MWSVFYLLLITVVHETSCGYTSGAPCNVRNTALLETRGIWRKPKDAVQCVDVRSLGNKCVVPEFSELNLATTLYADHMRLTIVPEFVLVGMPNVHLIDLSGNLLRKIAKDAFLPYKHLKVLLLGNNRILIPKTTALLNSPSLSSLSLSNNKIRRLRIKTFSELKNLTTLYLDRNLLQNVRRSVFSGLKHLKYLHLGNNRLKVLPNVVMLNPKAVLIVKGNPFNSTRIIKPETL
ncbi:hypothetical protein RN001_015554 [Aquatica leii]|uniref:Uncharacterized protein n=1 Tax=Aquatica leii TaxID=1421715 RepID=A0AAN7SNJ3_9COLE|nr:hypothetical protein RN001_015554 [Aquatica leii]